MTVIIYSEKSIDSLRPYIYEDDHDYIILRNTPPFMVNIGLIIKGNGCSNKNAIPCKNYVILQEISTTLANYWNNP